MIGKPVQVSGVLPAERRPVAHIWRPQRASKTGLYPRSLGGDWMGLSALL